MDNLGKLVTVLRDRCPECGSRLQVRQEENQYVGTRVFSIEKIVCQTCGYILPIKPQKRRPKRNIDTPWPDEM
jgi:DNA-directed RNA polymerase subunit M/transcription elongation factor TFIIS